MSKIDFANLFRNLKMSFTKHAPEILTGVGITGMITSTILAVKGTPKAITLLKKAEQEKGEELTPVEMIKTAWKCYIPSVSVATVSVFCLVGSSTISGKRNAALATAYTLVESSYKEYKDKVLDTVGEEKEKEIRDKVAEEKVRKNPVSDEVVILTNNGDTLCYDALSGRYFRSDTNSINKAINELNRRINLNFYVSLNDFYDEIGLEENDLGRALGWNSDKGLIEVSCSSQLSPKNEPCLVISFDCTPPLYGYESLY